MNFLYFLLFVISAMSQILAHPNIEISFDSHPKLFINEYSLAGIKAKINDVEVHVNELKDLLIIKLSIISDLDLDYSCHNIQRYYHYVKLKNINKSLEFLEFFDLMVHLKEDDKTIVQEEFSLRTKIRVGTIQTSHFFVMSIQLPPQIDLASLSIDIQWIGAKYRYDKTFLDF